MMADRIYDLRRGNADERDLRTNLQPHPHVRIPLSVDLRSKCPSVYDQGKLGSCSANAGVACRVMLLKEPKLLLSTLFLYYQERSLEHTTSEDSGATIRDICRATQRYGICEEKYMPYDISEYTDAPSREATSNAQKYRINAYKSLSSLDEIKHHLALTQQPVLMGIEVFESFESNETARTGRMPMPGKNEKKMGGHAVLAVGYMDNPRRRHPSGYLIVRNSWGENWGDHGYFYMPYDYVNDDYTFDYWVME